MNDKTINEEVRAIFKQIVESGTTKAYLDGPKNNVLVCSSMDEWVRVASKMQSLGYSCVSPGGYGGSHPRDRQNTHNKIWRSGTLCASVIEKRFWIFTLSQTSFDYQHIHE